MFKEMIEIFKSTVTGKYFCFDGRAGRREFWLFFLAVFIISFVLGIIDSIIGIKILSSLFSLAILLPYLGVATRRLHDIGKTGWLQLILLIPFVGAIILLILCAKQGMAESNKYGDVVKAE